MPLHPDSVAFLDAAEAWRAENGYGTWDTMGAERSRRALREGIALGRPPKADMARVEDCAIPARSGPRPCRIYVPHAAGPLPVVLYFHGGGYVIGGIEESDHETRRIAERTPAVVVSASYRLGPEHRFPAAVEDGLDALDWVAASAAALGGDPDRIMVGGTSAGGGLTAAVCRLAAERGGPAVALAYLLCPWLDLTLTLPSVDEFGEGFGLDRSELHWFTDCYLGAGAGADDPLVSPARPPVPTGTPPTLLLVAECDPLRDEALAYAERLKAAGVLAGLHLAPGLLHAFNVNAHLVPEAAEHLVPLDAALRQAAAG
ncbi:MAG: alpha/beta hydrolase [Inquilinus sp.]|nr:alpha/beta hydrolase [Inquilinus sp.]